MRFRELSLPEMLADPIIQAVMSSDGVKALELERLLNAASRRLGKRMATAIAPPGRRRRKAGHSQEPGR
jgi:hypothetical protein